MKFHRRVSLLLSMGIMAIGLISFKFSPAEATAANKGTDTVDELCNLDRITSFRDLDMVKALIRKTL